MNTPAHLAASLFAWRKEPHWSAAAAITLGALLPDLPMFGFYAVQKVLGKSEQVIWSTLYFKPEWQLFFDVFNSIPLAIVAWCFFRWTWMNRVGQLIAASALLHLVFDLPLHHDDAHRHFLPFSHWRFESPVSYWDPAHHGKAMLVCEFVLAMAASGFVAFRGIHKPMRTVARFNLGLYLFVASIGVIVAAFYYAT